LIIGYYGNGNFGDEVMLQSIIERLDFTKNSIVVTSGSYPIKYDNVNYFPMHTIMSDNEISKLKRIWRVIKNLKKEIKSSNKIYIGGGTLIGNKITSNILLLIISLIAKVNKKNIHFLSIGIEKLSPLNRVLSKIIFSLANEIKVRDKYSLSQIPKSSFEKDIAIFQFQKLNSNLKVSEDFIIAPALFPHENIEIKTNNYIALFEKFNIYKPIIIVSQSLNKHSDLQLANSINKKIDSKIVVLKTFDDVKNINFSGNIISERYHIGILSHYINSNLILIGKSTKILTLASELKVNCYPTINSIELTFKKPYIDGITKE
jgi:polysaccharide pyruvyl transferase WcaK-like protein